MRDVSEVDSREAAALDAGVMSDEEVATIVKMASDGSELDKEAAEAEVLETREFESAGAAKAAVRARHWVSTRRAFESIS